jgi:copper(I)-binding protein
VLATPALADSVKIENAWARATAPVKTTNGKRKTIAVEAEARRTSGH